MNNKIAETRKILKIKQETLAKDINISRAHLSEIENGKAEPGGLVMLKIASALQQPVENIFFINNVV